MDFVRRMYSTWEPSVNVRVIDSTYPNADLESERITQVDIGIRHRRENVDLDLVLFGLHYTDRISSVLTGAVTADGRDIVQSQNIEEADIYGWKYRPVGAVAADWALIWS